MKKNLWASIILLILCIGVLGSAETSYAMSSKMLASTAIRPTVTGILPTPKPKSTPTPTPTPKSTPTPAATQPPQAPPTVLPQVSPVSTNTVLPNSPVTVAPPTAVPTATAVVSTTPTVIAATPITVKSTLPFSTTPALQNVAGQGFNALIVFLVLGVGAPLLLIGGGVTLWLLMRRKTNRNRPVRSEVAQAKPWANGYGMPSPLYALQSTSDLIPLAQAAGASGASPKPAPSVQPTYTASKLRPMTSAFLPQMLAMSLNEEAGYPLNNELRSLQIGSLDLSLNANRAIEANGNGQMPLRLASPTTLVDTPTSSMPSSPPISSTLAVAGPRR